MKKQELKKILLDMKKTDFEVPDSVHIPNLAEDLVNNIGDIDPVLRDELVLTCLWTLIEYDDIATEQQQDILNRLLSDKHLFLGLGKEEDDSVFNRTFSILIIGALVKKLKNINYPSILKKVLEYGHKECDLRGYVNQKGWAHSTAHLADTLIRLAEHEQATTNDLKEILVLIHEKITDNTYVYIHGEDERIARTTEVIFRNEKLKQEDVLHFLKCFKKADGEYIANCKTNLNAKNYLRSLFFRLRKSEYKGTVINVIDKLLAEEFSVKY